MGAIIGTILHKRNGVFYPCTSLIMLLLCALPLAVGAQTKKNTEAQENYATAHGNKPKPSAESVRLQKIHDQLWSRLKEINVRIKLKKKAEQDYASETEQLEKVKAAIKENDKQIAALKLKEMDEQAKKKKP